MTEQSETWAAPQQGRWQSCPRYSIWITNCSRFFVCQKDGIEACRRAQPQDMPKEPRYKTITFSERLKQIGSSVKQSALSVKMVGV